MSEQDNNIPAPDAPVENAPEVEETEESLAAEGNTQPELTKEEKKEIQKMMKSYEFKANGKTRKVDIDLNDDESIRKHLEKSFGAQETWEEASKYRKQAEQLVDLLQKDPRALLKNPALGIDVKKLAEQLLDEQLEEAKLTPEQKRIRELETAIKAREDKEKEERERQDNERRAKLTQEQYEKAERDMMEALDSSEIGASPYAVRRVADIMSALIEDGYENVEIKQIMPFAEQLIRQELSGHIGKHKDPNKLEKLIGKDILKEYRKSKITSVKKTPNSSTPDTGKKTEDKPKEEPKKIKLSDFSSW